MTEHEAIDVDVPPSGTGCADCNAADPAGWWVHLRRCATCGHVGCCDSSPAQHATAHARTSGHPVVRSFEPGEDWFFDYESGQPFDGRRWHRPCHARWPRPHPAPAAASRVTGCSTSTSERPRFPG